MFVPFIVLRNLPSLFSLIITFDKNKIVYLEEYHDQNFGSSFLIKVTSFT